MQFTQLVDAYGRVASDLRVSLTDRCNLRCTYCMPAEGMTWLPTDDTLTDDEVVRVVKVAVREGHQTCAQRATDPLHKA